MRAGHRILGVRLSAEFTAGYETGAAWARANPPASLADGVPAHERVPEAHLAAAGRGRGYVRGVWGAWCRRHPAQACFGTWICREAVRADAGNDLRVSLHAATLET